MATLDAPPTATNREEVKGTENAPLMVSDESTSKAEQPAAADSPAAADASAHKRKSESEPSSRPSGKKTKATAHPWPKRKVPLAHRLLRLSELFLTAAQGLQNIQWEEVPHPPWSILLEDEPEWPTKNPDGSDHMYYVSKKGALAYDKMCDQAEKCDTDIHEVYLGNDFTGYGQVEVMENAIQLWEKEFRKKTCRAEELWFRMEPIALWLNNGEIAWHMIDDGERHRRLCRLMCGLFVETFRMLHKEKLIHPESPIKNIGLMAGLAALGRDSNAIKDYHMTWFDRIVGMCRHGGVEIDLGPEEIGERERIEKYLNKDPEAYTVEDIEEWKDEDDDEDAILQGFDALVSNPRPKGPALARK
jgi:hypothetical protein